MTVAPDGALLVLQPAEKLLLSYPAGAGGPAKTPAPNITTLAVDQWGRLWTASGATVTGPPGVGVVKTPERTEVVALAPADARAVWVADARGRRVVRIDALAGVTATAALPERADPIALAADGEGGVWVIDSRDGALVAVSPDGAVRVSAPLEAVARDPVDLDVDAAGFVYVLDAAAPGVLVFGPDGKLLVRQPLQREGENGLPRPALLAVARDGGVAIHDAKLRTIRWLR